MWLHKNNVVCSVHLIYEVNAKWRLACFQPYDLPPRQTGRSGRSLLWDVGTGSCYLKCI